MTNIRSVCALNIEQECLYLGLHCLRPLYTSRRACLPLDPCHIEMGWEKLSGTGVSTALISLNKFGGLCLMHRILNVLLSLLEKCWKTYSLLRGRPTWSKNDISIADFLTFCWFCWFWWFCLFCRFCWFCWFCWFAWSPSGSASLHKNIHFRLLFRCASIS